MSFSTARAIERRWRWPVLSFVLTLLPDNLALLKQPDIDIRVMVLVLGLTVGLAVAVALWPIRQSATVSPRPAPQAAGDTGARLPKWRFVVAAEVAGALLLAVLAGFLMAPVAAAYSIELPIEASGVVAIEAAFQGPGSMMGSSQERVARVAAILARLRELPTLSGAGATSAQILRGAS